MHHAQGHLQRMRAETRPRCMAMLLSATQPSQYEHTRAGIPQSGRSVAMQAIKPTWASSGSDVARKREGVILLEFASVNKQGPNTNAPGGARDYSWDSKQVLLRCGTVLCRLVYCG